MKAELFLSHGSKAVAAHQHGDMRVWEVLGWQITETSSCTDKPTVSLKLGQGFIGDGVARMVDRVHSPVVPFGGVAHRHARCQAPEGTAEGPPEFADRPERRARTRRPPAWLTATEPYHRLPRVVLVVAATPQRAGP